MRTIAVWSITCSRGNRSASTDTNGAAIADGMIRISATRPTAAAPPMSYAYTESATM